MGWERRGGNRYYYRKARVDGKVTSEYVGREAGPGALFAELDRLDRRARAARRRCELDLAEELDGADGAVGRCCDRVEAFARAYLAAAGYRRHARGRWRRRRAMGPIVTADLPGVPEGAGPAIRRAAGRLTELAERRAVGVQGGDKRPDIARDAKGQMDALRAELAGPAPSPIEALLVDRVVLCWFQVQTAEACTTAQTNFAAEEKVGRYRDRAHNRYLSSLKALAQVRRLRLPALQVNIATDGGQQVNVGS